LLSHGARFRRWRRAGGWESKKQEHDLTESLGWIGDGQLRGHGTGTLKVFGDASGTCKLGKVRDDQSAWALSTGTLYIQQSLNIAFRALVLRQNPLKDSSHLHSRAGHRHLHPVSEASVRSPHPPFPP